MFSHLIVVAELLWVKLCRVEEGDHVVAGLFFKLLFIFGRCVGQGIYFIVELLVVEHCQHQKLLLHFLKIQCFHLLEHCFHRLK